MERVNGNAAPANFPFFPGVTKAIKVLENSVWGGRILDKMFSDRIVRCIISTLPVLLSYSTPYAVMSYSMMLYCNQSTVISYSVTLYRNQNSIVSYSNA